MAVSDVAEVTRAREAELAAKRPATHVAGPYGHPFHPILVTVPIGAWVASLVLDIASRSADDGGSLGRGAYWLIGIGVVGALVAALFGLMDLVAVPGKTRAKRVGLTHMVLNLTVVAAFVASFIWRADRDASRPTSWGLLALSIGALLVLAVSGWLGGKLAYRYGVRVADEEVQLEGYLGDGHRGMRTVHHN